MNVNKENIVELARELVSSLIGTNAEIEFGEKFDAVVEAGNYNEDGLEKVISDYRDEFMPSVVLQEASEESISATLNSKGSFIATLSIFVQPLLSVIVT